MLGRRWALMGAVVAATAVLAGCTGTSETVETPGLEPRGTVLTTVKPARQDLTNRLSLTGKVAINPVFGIVAPVAGEVRYLTPPTSKTVSTSPTRIASVWSKGKAHRVDIPAGATMAGRLVEDRSTVPAGMPIVSARYGAYGVVAEIDSAQAYKISGSVDSVQGQIKNGPGPFPCALLGTVAALPAGTVPEPPKPSAAPQPSGGPGPQSMPSSGAEPPPGGGEPGSEPTGLRLVCTAPADTKMINGASVTLDVVTEKAKGVLVLPVEAVAGTQGKGKVDIVGPNRDRQTTDVTLGLTDGKVVEIKSGLNGSETIAVPGPDLPEAKNPQEQGSPGVGG